jgi:hypothetical protein
VERPFLDQKGNVPDGMYLITFDPYYKEESQDQTSLWSFKVWKLDNQISQSFVNLPVAWWAGRPLRYEECHAIMFMAADFYNGKIQGEISGGGQSVLTWAKTHRILHKLCNEPETAHNKENSGKAAATSYLMNMPTERKRMGLQYLEDWHVAPRGLDEKGNMVLNVHRIFDIAWLKEMRKHNPEKGNYDRISDAIVAMFMLKENYAQQMKHQRKVRSFYTRELFGGGDDSGGVTSAY